jgi:hypothetical protein
MEQICILFFIAFDVLACTIPLGGQVRDDDLLIDVDDLANNRILAEKYRVRLLAAISLYHSILFRDIVKIA